MGDLSKGHISLLSSQFNMKINHYKGFRFLMESVKSVLNVKMVVGLLRCERSLWAGSAEPFVSLLLKTAFSF